KRTKQKVLSALQKFAKGSAGLREAYSNVIQRINGQLEEDRLLAQRALSWIIYAQRPLMISELRVALAIEAGDKALNSDGVYDVEDVVSVCAGLVTVDEESSIIRLVHYTVQEYLVRTQLDWYPAAQEHIAITCLTFLSFEIFRSGGCADDKRFEQRLVENVFFDYAAHY
ncbi:ankyrin repeat protein, partial [Hyaloscypha finlandica]